MLQRLFRIVGLWLDFILINAHLWFCTIGKSFCHRIASKRVHKCDDCKEAHLTLFAPLLASPLFRVRYKSKDLIRTKVFLFNLRKFPFRPIGPVTPWIHLGRAHQYFRISHGCASSGPILEVESNASSKSVRSSKSFLLREGPVNCCNWKHCDLDQKCT